MSYLHESPEYQKDLLINEEIAKAIFEKNYSFEEKQDIALKLIFDDEEKILDDLSCFQKDYLEQFFEDFYKSPSQKMIEDYRLIHWIRLNGYGQQEADKNKEK